ncbi:MAG TPA: ferritin family protein [Casimicrobiaceae bacterium]
MSAATRTDKTKRAQRRPERHKAAEKSGRTAGAASRTLTELMAQALTMEREAAQRYAEFADAMEVHNNLEVAALFRKMASIERKHAAQIMAQMGWKEGAALPIAKLSWEGFEAPETTPGDEVHYLMQPYHVLELALANEQRAERFFARLVRAATRETVRRAARELQAEEAEHVALVRAWMKKVPKPDRDWASDPDPATTTD